MAVVYYPTHTVLYKRNTISASFEQVVLNTQPNTILYFGTGSDPNEISGSVIYITSSHALTASLCLTSSFLTGFIESASYSLNSLSSSWARSASWAPGGVGSSVSSSWASSSLSSSYSLNALSASWAPGGVGSSVSSSWASSSVSASYALSASSISGLMFTIISPYDYSLLSNPNSGTIYIVTE
jgi:hypothetical protein